MPAGHHLLRDAGHLDVLGDSGASSGAACADRGDRIAQHRAQGLVDRVVVAFAATVRDESASDAAKISRTSPRILPRSFDVARF
jgi:hypothetical protein